MQQNIASSSASEMEISALDAQNTGLSPVERVPVDIMDRVFDTLPSSDLKKCNRVCRSWASIVNPKLYRRLRFGLGGMFYSEGVKITPEHVLKCLRLSPSVQNSTEELLIDAIGSQVTITISWLHNILTLLPNLRRLSIDLCAVEIRRENTTAIARRVAFPRPLQLQYVSLRTARPLDVNCLLHFFAAFRSVDELFLDAQLGKRRQAIGVIPRLHRSAKLQVRCLISKYYPTPAETRSLESFVDMESVQSFRDTLPRSLCLLLPLPLQSVAVLDTTLFNTSISRQLPPDMLSYPRLSTLHATSSMIIQEDGQHHGPHDWVPFMHSLLTARSPLTSLHLTIRLSLARARVYEPFSIVSVRRRDECVLSLHRSVIPQLEAVEDWILMGQMIDTSPMLTKVHIEFDPRDEVRLDVDDTVFAAAMVHVIPPLLQSRRVAAHSRLLNVTVHRTRPYDHLIKWT